MITYEVEGAIVRISRRLPNPWTDKQRGVIARAKQMFIVVRRVDFEPVKSVVNGAVIVEASSTSYMLAACVMHPDLYRFDTDPDLEEFKARFPNHKVVADSAIDPRAEDDKEVELLDL